MYKVEFKIPNEYGKSIFCDKFDCNIENNIKHYNFTNVLYFKSYKIPDIYIDFNNNRYLGYYNNCKTTKIETLNYFENIEHSNIVNILEVVKNYDEGKFESEYLQEFINLEISLRKIIDQINEELKIKKLELQNKQLKPKKWWKVW